MPPYNSPAGWGSIIYRHPKLEESFSVDKLRKSNEEAETALSNAKKDITMLQTNIKTLPREAENTEVRTPA